MAIIGATVTIALIYVLGLIDESTLEPLIDKSGLWGWVVLAGFILFSQIFAPLSGSPALFVGFKMFDFIPTMILFYVVSMVSACINFGISRFWGRKALRWIIGRNGMAQVDELADAEQDTLLRWSRILGYYLFDIISFAIGLTGIRFKKYLWTTAIYTAIPWGISLVVFSFVDMKSTVGMIAYFCSIVGASIVFGHLLQKLVRQRRHPPSEA